MNEKRNYIPASILVTIFLLNISCTGSHSSLPLEYDPGCKNGTIEIWGSAALESEKKIINRASEVRAQNDACRNFVYSCIAQPVTEKTELFTSQAIASRLMYDTPGLCDGMEVVKSIRNDRYNVLFKLNKDPDWIEQAIINAEKEYTKPELLLIVLEEFNLAGEGKIIHDFDDKYNLSRDRIKDYLVKNEIRVKGMTLPFPVSISHEVIIENPDKYLRKSEMWKNNSSYDIIAVAALEANPDPESYDRADLRIYNTTGIFSYFTLSGMMNRKQIRSQYNGEGYTEMEAAVNSMKNLLHGKIDGEASSFLKTFTTDLFEDWKFEMSHNSITLELKGFTENDLDGFETFLYEFGEVQEVNVESDHPDKIKVIVAATVKDVALIIDHYKFELLSLMNRSSNSELLIEDLRPGTIVISIK